VTSVETSTQQELSKLDNTIHELECYANLLEAIKAMSDNDEVKALKAMIAISRSQTT